jgi:hypothetical protein
MKTTPIELDFLGQRIALKSESDPQIIREAVEIAQLKIQDAARRGRTAPPHQVALLALLDLAEEYARAKKRAGDHRDDLTRKSTQLIEMIDSALQ